MPWNLPVLTRFCWCCSLRVGALIIGYFSMFTSFMIMACISIAIAMVSEFVENEKHDPFPIHRPEDLNDVANQRYITLTIYLLVYLYYFVMGLFIVIGVHRNKPQLLKYYINTGMFTLAIAVAVVVVTVVIAGVYIALPLLFYSAYLFYCILVVRSVYFEMEKQNRPKVK